MVSWLVCTATSGEIWKRLGFKGTFVFAKDNKVLRFSCGFLSFPSNYILKTVLLLVPGTEATNMPIPVCFLLGAVTTAVSVCECYYAGAYHASQFSLTDHVSSQEC